MEKQKEFIEIPIHDFIVGSALPIDVYIQLTSDKTVQVAKAGDRVDLERFKKYESKEVTHLLIRSRDYAKYMSRSLSVAGIAINNSEMSLGNRETQLIQLASNVFGEVEHFGMTKDAFGHAKDICSATVALCQGKSDLFELMGHFLSLDSSLYSHSVAVSVVSVMIGKQLNWSPLINEKLALGGLLHDIGKQELPTALLNKPRAFMTPKEVTDYESHCFRGMQILRSLADIPDDIVSIAYEHHENALGLGYPRKLKQMYINPLARIVGLANEFCHLTMHSPHRAKPLTGQEAIAHIRKVMGQPFWPDAYTALKKLLPGDNEKKTA